MSDTKTKESQQEQVKAADAANAEKPNRPAGETPGAEARADAGREVPKEAPKNPDPPVPAPTAPAPSAVPSEAEAKAADGKRLTKEQKQVAELPEAVRAARVAGTKVDGTR
jgi:hypothetical protein